MTGYAFTPRWPFLAAAGLCVAFCYLPDLVFWVKDRITDLARAGDDGLVHDFGGDDG